MGVVQCTVVYTCIVVVGFGNGLNFSVRVRGSVYSSMIDWKTGATVQVLYSSTFCRGASGAIGERVAKDKWT